MSKNMQNFLRWIMVLPGAIIAAILSTFLLHYILYFTLTNFVTPYAEFPERALTPFVIALTFIRVGSEIAPNNKFKVGIALFSIWIFFSGGFIMSTLMGGKWFGKDLYLEAKGIAPILGIVGAFVALYLVRKKNRENVSPTTKDELNDLEAEHTSSTNKQTFYDRYGTDIFNLIFVAIFVWCLFSEASRRIVFIIILTLNLIFIFFALKGKKYTTRTMKLDLVKYLIFSIALAVALLKPEFGLYVTILYLGLLTFDAIRHFIVRHIVPKTSTPSSSDK